MSFTYARTAHFADTDAAGVVFFANYMAICHEGYEESLAASGIDLKSFFADAGVMIPIVKSEAEYLRPISCGDKLNVRMAVNVLSEYSFEVRYEIVRLGPPVKSAARVRTEHVCIDSTTRARKLLPPALLAWTTAA